MANLLVRVLEELGLVNLYRVHVDVKILCLQRFVRLFAYGASTLVLVAYLQALGISKTAIGLFMTLTLVGDVAISFFLTLFADRMGRKAVLGMGAALMAASGAVFATCTNYWVLLAAAVFGVISPSGNEIGPFRAIEESVVAHLTYPDARGDVYAWYSLSGTAGTAFGMMVCGWLVHAVTNPANISWEAWPLVEAYRWVFHGYAAFGLIKLVLVFFLSRDVEVDGGLKEDAGKAVAVEVAGEDAPLLGGDGSPAVLSSSEVDEQTAAPGTPDQASDEESKKGKKGYSLSAISKESVEVITMLCILFGLDAFASGLAPLSWVAFFFRSHYGLEEGKLGSVFFTTSLIAAASMIVASSIAKRFGNVKTMVFTHLPSAVFLALIPVVDNVHWSLAFLVLRSCTQSMDVAPRSAFMAAIILPEERTAVMGLINVVKTTAQSLGPFVTGALADHSLFWVSFVCAGSLKASYDIGMLVLFENHERNAADKAKRNQRQEAAQDDEEAATGQA